MVCFPNIVVEEAEGFAILPIGERPRGIFVGVVILFGEEREEGGVEGAALTDADEAAELRDDDVEGVLKDKPESPFNPPRPEESGADDDDDDEGKE